MEGLAKIVAYLTNPELYPPLVFLLFQILRFFFIVFSVFLAGMIVFLLTQNRYLEFRYFNDWAEFKKKKPYTKENIVKEWNKIVKQAREGDDSDRKLSIIEADEKVNEILGKLGYEGKNIEEKLSDLNEDIVPNMEELRKVHKRKRDIVYDPGYILSKEEANEMISVYEKTFKHMQFL